jgi:hypothetical protein
MCGLSRGFFQIALKNIKSVSFNHAPVGEGVSPLDTTDYSTSKGICQSSKYTKMGILQTIYLYKMRIDKLLGRWYNGKSDRHASEGSGKNPPSFAQ